MKSTLADSLKRAIAARKESRYATAKNAGIEYKALVRFLDEGTDIRLSTVQALVDSLGLELRKGK